MFLFNIILYFLVSTQIVIDKNQFEKIITNYILLKGHYQKENVIIEFRNLPEKIVLQDEETKLKFEDDNSVSFRGNFTIPVQIEKNGNIIKRMFVSLKIRTFDSVFCANKQMKQFETLSMEKISKNWVETTLLNGLESKHYEDILGKRVIKNISSGQPLTINILENLPIISKEKPIKLMVKVNNITVYIDGKAKQEGRKDDIIFVENSSSKAILKGKVLDEKTVEVLR